MIEASTADHAWFKHVALIASHGILIAPRGAQTYEILNASIVVDQRFPVVTNEARKVSTRFLGAEALWIISGDDTVDGIVPYNSKMLKYSDDGKTFFGAYGPPIVSQLDYIVSTLTKDTSSRQAGLTIWRQNPPASKDIPCTVSIFFYLRVLRSLDQPGYELVTNVFMRSSDAYLGLPYDIFTFSMLGHLVACRLNDPDRRNLPGKDPRTDVVPGRLFVTMGSAHIYVRDIDRVQACLDVSPIVTRTPERAAPAELARSENELLRALHGIRRLDAESIWWR